MSSISNRRILVTGAHGFLGRNVCRAILDYSPAELITPRQREFDLRKPEVVRTLIAAKRPEVVIHLAAVVGGIGANRENPGKYFYDNAVMAIHLMEESRLAGIEKFVSIATICAYPKHTPVPFREDDLWNGYPEETNAPYGLAKKMMLVQGQAYRQQYGFNAITLLPVNLYGPGDNFDPRSSHVIPALIRKAIEARDHGATHIDVWGTGAASREFLFVRDAAAAIAAAADRYDGADPVNIGSGCEITIRDLVEMICELSGFEGEIRWDHSKPDGQPRRCLDTSRAEQAFGFRASTAFRDGLLETIAWYEKQKSSQTNPISLKDHCISSSESTTSSHSHAPGAPATPHDDDSGPRVETQRQHPPRRALITGITGQDGSYLAELLLAKGYEVWGVIRRSSSFNTGRIDHIYQDPHDQNVRLRLCYGDLNDASSINRILKMVRPHEIYNLGAQSHVKVSFEIPEYTGDVTGLGAIRILESMRELDVDAKYYQASSSELYGKVLETPQTENTPFYPRSPYAAAKAYAYYVTRNYRESYGLFAVNGILFNHESPRRGETFVTRKVTRAVARIALGQQDCLFLGNLDAKRDWGFAGDYVEAMWLMMQADEPEDYVIATGETHSVREFCERAFMQIGRQIQWEGQGSNERGIDLQGRVVVRVDPRYFRPAEVDLLLGDPTKARTKLGWSPATSFDELIRMMVEHDKEIAQRELMGQTLATN